MNEARPVLRWHGGKWRLAPWIISHFPQHTCFVEPFGGAASVLFRKPQSRVEIYNDLDDEVVNLFRVLRDEAAANRLIALLELTPFSRVEFEDAYQPSDDPVERARRMIVRSFMGYGSDSALVADYTTGFRGFTDFRHTTPAHDWAGYPESLKIAAKRARGLIVECNDGFDIIRKYDGVETLFYVDPPYVGSTRGRNGRRRGEGFHVYAHEMDDVAHAELLDLLRRVRGMVVLSGYPTALYDDRLVDWRRVETAAYADGARPRTEVLWINPAAAAAIDGDHGPLFAGSAA